LALKVRSSVVLAAENVKEKSSNLAENMKEKSSNLAESVSENAATMKTKSIEVAENVKDRTILAAGSAKKGAVAAAETMQGFLAPRTAKKEGFLLKQVGGNWIEYYFILKEGNIYVLPMKDAEKAEFIISLECVKKVEPLDSLVTGKPNCFSVVVSLRSGATTVNNWAFFGANVITITKVNNQEVNLMLQAHDEDEMSGWLREFSSITNGLAFQENVKNTGKMAWGIVQSTFVGTAAGLVGFRAGRKVANKIIT